MIERCGNPLAVLLRRPSVRRELSRARLGPRVPRSLARPMIPGAAPTAASDLRNPRESMMNQKNKAWHSTFSIHEICSEKCTDMHAAAAGTVNGFEMPLSALLPLQTCFRDESDCGAKKIHPICRNFDPSGQRGSEKLCNLTCKFCQDGRDSLGGGVGAKGRFVHSFINRLVHPLLA